jgi:hypothetical protein
MHHFLENTNKIEPNGHWKHCKVSFFFVDQKSKMAATTGEYYENQGYCRETIGCTEGQQQRQWQQTHIPNFNGDIKIR